MALAPELNAPDLVSAAEVVPVAILAEPPALTGSLAGLPTRRHGTIPLAILRAPVRDEELGATTAFASGLRAAHGEPDLDTSLPGRKRKRRTRRKEILKKEEKI